MANIDQSLVGTFQKHIEDMRNLSLCKICIKPFYEPFILGCGHTYCYSCLASWFGGAQGRRKNRNCPDCRAIVTVQPSPNYLLRDLVHMFIGRIELLPEDETIEEHQQAKEEEAGLLAADRAGPGLFKGVFLRRPHPIIRLGHGVLDQEDNVIRCPECHWELQDGECLQCGFHEFEASGDSDSDSEDDESDMLSLRTIATEYDSDGIPIPPVDLLRHYYGSASDSEADHADDYDDDEDMDGFIDDELDGIDDDDDHGSQATLTNAHHPTNYHNLHNMNEDHQTDDTGTQTTNYDDPSDVATNYDEPAEESEQEDDVRPSQRLPRRATRIVISDDEEDEGHDSSSGSEEDSEDREISDSTEQDDSDDDDDDEEGPGPSESTDQDETEGGDSESDESDDTAIQPPQSIARRREHLQNMRARRNDPGYRSHRHNDRFQQQNDMRHRSLHHDDYRLGTYGNSKRWSDADNNPLSRGFYRH